MEHMADPNFAEPFATPGIKKDSDLAQVLMSLVKN